MPTLIRLLCLPVLSLMVSTSAVASPASTSESGGTLGSLFAQQSTPKFLPVHQAFNVSATQKEDVLTVIFKVTPKHYIYKDKLKLTLPQGVSMGAWTFNKPHTMIDDPEFGRVAVFEEDVTASVKLTSAQDVTAPVTIRWQGCAKAGLCYPPETTKVTISLTGVNHAGGEPSNAKRHPDESENDTPTTKPQTHQVTALPKAKTASAAQPWSIHDTTDEAIESATLSHTKTSSQLTDTPPNTKTQEEHLDGASASYPPIPNTPIPNTPIPNSPVPDASNDSILSSNHQPLVSQADPFGINKNPVLAVLLLFLAGLLLSFTPCIYPMIPIVANIVAHNKTYSPLRGFALSASYGLGVASAYGVLGGLIAWFGQAVGVLGLLQNPYVLGVFAIIFALLALYMFGVIRVSLPSRLRQLLHQTSKAADKKLGSMSGSFLVGALSALVVSPCVSAPMAGALTAVSVSGSVPFGFVALFSLGLGLSIPLMFIGLAQGRFMPRAGEWMNRVKEFCGLLLFAVSLSLLERLLSSPAMLVIWAVWFAMTAMWLFRIKNLASQVFALMSVIWTVCLVAGAAMGGADPWRPLQKLSQSENTLHMRADVNIKSLAELDAVLASHDKVLVDITADWCVECRIMERTLFTNRPAALSEYQVVKLDVTQTDERSRAVLARYGLFGPPALLIYKAGQLQIMLLGETKRADFEATLAKF